jgi:hypothetical protein
MRRFDQFIRQADHFGKPRPDVNAAHHHRDRFLTWAKHSSQAEGIRPVNQKGKANVRDE